MKVTDEQILDAVWRGQVSLLKHGIFHNYFGGQHALTRVDSFSMAHSCYISTPSMKNFVDVDLSQSQLKRRINRLVEKGELVTLSGPTSYGTYNFNLPSDVMWPLFSFAHNFMREKGITDKPQHWPFIKEWKEELEAEIIAKFSRKSP